MYKKTSQFVETAKNMRKQIIRMAYLAQVGHMASALSIIDIVTALYFGVLHVYPNNPTSSRRDRFILSKGHAASALYAVLAEKGFFPKKWLDSYCQNNGRLGTHPDKSKIPGVEWTTGSLGHGLSVGIGMAIALKIQRQKQRVFVLISDAESQEGEIWEAALTAAHHQLSNVTVIVDYNGVQAFGKVREVLNLEPLQNKWQAFGWKTTTVDGHDIASLIPVLRKQYRSRPHVIIAKTIRGNGISFMQHSMYWYYNAPTKDEMSAAYQEI